MYMTRSSAIKSNSNKKFQIKLFSVVFAHGGTSSIDAVGVVAPVVRV